MQRERLCRERERERERVSERDYTEREKKNCVKEKGREKVSVCV